MTQGYSLTVDKLKSLSSDSPVLFLQQSLKLLPCSVDVLDPEEILYPFDCLALSKVTVQREMTHAIIAS